MILAQGNNDNDVGAKAMTDVMVSGQGSYTEFAWWMGIILHHVC